MGFKEFSTPTIFKQSDVTQTASITHNQHSSKDLTWQIQRLFSFSSSPKET